MRIIIINLPSEKSRLAFQQEQFSKLGLSFTLLPAKSANDLTMCMYDQLAYHWERPMRKSEVACFLSHKTAWENTLKSGEPTLILEDDALLSRHIKNILEAIEPLENIDLISLEVRSRKKLVAKIPSVDSQYFRLFDLYQDRTGAAGYILWPEGARKLLSKTNVLPAALADAFISSTYSLRAMQIEPAAVTQIDQIDNYKIPLDIKSVSSISNSQKPSGSTSSEPSLHKPHWQFKISRIYSQLKMGMRHLSVLYKSKRRFITLIPEDF